MEIKYEHKNGKCQVLCPHGHKNNRLEVAYIGSFACVFTCPYNEDGKDHNGVIHCDYPNKRDK